MMGKSGGPGNQVKILRRYALFLAVTWTLSCLVLAIFNLRNSPSDHQPTQLLSFSVLWLLGMVVIVACTWEILKYLRERDISNQALIDRGEQYKSVVEQAADGIFVSDREGNFVDANSSGCAMLGYSRDEICTMNIRDLMLEDDLKANPLRMDLLLAGETVVAERTLRHKNGSLFPVEVSAKMLSDGRLQAIVRDITGRKQFEGKLREERDRAQQYLDIAGVMFVAINADQTVRMINRKGAAILGWMEEEIVGKNWFDNFLPESVREEVREGFVTIMAGDLESTEYYENPIMTKTGEERIIAWHNSLVHDESGTITGTISSGEDITERKQAETALRDSLAQNKAVLEALPDLIFRMKRDGTVTDFFVPSAEAFPLKPDDVIGGRLVNGLPKEVAEKGQHYIEQCLDTQTIQVFEYELSLPSIGPQNYEARMAVSGADEVLAIVRNITERKQVEMALQDSLAQNKAVLEAMPDLMFRISRDGRHLDFFAPRAEMLFAEPGTIIGTTVAELLPSDVAETYQHHIEQCLDSHEIQIFEYQLDYPDTGTQDFEARMAVSGADEVLAIVRNITERKRDEKILEMQARQQLMVAEFGQRALAGHDLNPLMDEVVAGVAQILNVDYCKVLELLPDGDNFVVRAGIGWTDVVVGETLVPAGEDSQAGYTLNTEDPVVVADLRSESRFRGPKLLDDHEVISGMSVVIPGREQPYGVLGAHSRRLRGFTRDDIVFLQSVANILATAQARKQTEREREELLVAERDQRLLAETLTEIALALTAQISRTAALDAILDQAHRLVPYNAANIMWLEGEMMYTARWRGYDAMGGEDLIANLVQPLPTFQVDADAIDQGQPVIVTDTHEDPNWVPIEALSWVRSNIAMPIRLGDRGLGLLHLDSDTPGQFTPRDAARLAPLAGIAAIALENAQLYADLERRVLERTAELSAANKQTDTILQNVADAIVFTDIGNNILYVNPAWERLTGYTFAEVIGQNPRILNSGESADALFEDMWQTVLAGKVWRGVLKNKRKDGTVYDNEQTIAPVTDVSGIVEFFVAIQRDVTETRELEAMKTRFIANAAHDLNNPIASLSLRLHLMKHAPERLDYHIEVMEGQIQHLTTLVEDLLTLSRLDRDVALPELEPTDLNTLVSLVVESQQPLTEHHGINLRFIAGDAMAPAQIDARQIERVVINLVTNALNYTLENGAVTVTVAQEGEWGLIQVSDTGIGIAADDLGHIFERFYRSREARDTAKGTGLGLAIVEEIVTRHQGRIEVESVVGDGTTVRVYLPSVVEE